MHKLKLGVLRQNLAWILAARHIKSDSGCPQIQRARLLLWRAGQFCGDQETRLLLNEAAGHGKACGYLLGSIAVAPAAFS